MFGLLIEMKAFVNKISPNDLTYDLFRLLSWFVKLNFINALFSFSHYRKDDYFSYKTNRYKLNYYETASGIKIVLNTDVNVGNIRDLLHQLYENVSLFKLLMCVIIFT